MRNRALTLVSFLLLTSIQGLFCWNITYTPSVDWVASALRIDITASPETGDPAPPAARQSAEKAIERALPGICLEAVSAIRADSQSTIGELVRSDSEVLAWFRNVYTRAERHSGSFTGDLAGLSVSYVLRFYPDLIRPLVRHSRAYKGNLRLDWEPAGPFTGIIIYAAGELPEYTKSSTARLEPCLLPKFYDQELNLLSAPYMVEPDTLLVHGVVAYSHTLDEQGFLDRVGYYPMRLTARGIFGTHPTDLVLSMEWTNKILGSRDIQRLLARGRVVIVIDPPGNNPSASAGP